MGGYEVTLRMLLARGTNASNEECSGSRFRLPSRAARKGHLAVAKPLFEHEDE